MPWSLRNHGDKRCLSLLLIQLCVNLEGNFNLAKRMLNVKLTSTRTQALTRFIYIYFFFLFTLNSFFILFLSMLFSFYLIAISFTFQSYFFFFLLNNSNAFAAAFHSLAFIPTNYFSQMSFAKEKKKIYVYIYIIWNETVEKW